MNPIFYLYNEFLFRPLFNGLIFFYTALPIHDIGLAIILLTIAIRLLVSPLFWKARVSQQKLALLQPEIKKIQERFKKDKEGQGRAMMELYRERGASPFSGCFIMLVQFPILIALFQVFYHGFDPERLSLLYTFIQSPGTINPISFGLLDLSKGNIFLGVVAALAQFFQTKFSMGQDSQAGQNEFGRMMNWQMLYIFPIFILIWSYTFPSALVLYWTVLSILGILQEIIMKRTMYDRSRNDKNRNQNPA